LYGKKEKVQFYHIVKGSLPEIQNQLLVTKDEFYPTQVSCKKISTDNLSRQTSHLTNKNNKKT
jgi:hypothetical protein